MRPVNKPEYWKERLENAPTNNPHHSVFSVSDVFLDKMTKSHEKTIEPYRKLRVLDAGCSYGRMSVYFDNYVGVDIAPAFTEKAKELYPNKEFIVGDLKTLPFKDKEFDVAMCCVVKQMIVGDLGIDYWNEVEKELTRVAKKLLILESND